MWNPLAEARPRNSTHVYRGILRGIGEFNQSLRRKLKVELALSKENWSVRKSVDLGCIDK
jgi:hypothetical protein